MTRKLLRTLIVLAAYLLLWQIAAMAVGQELLVPAPLVVLGRLGALVARASFWRSVGASLLRMISGWFIGAVAGALLAVLSFAFAPVRSFVSPLITALRATPVASFIILALVWLATGIVPAFIALLIVLPVMYTGVFAGLANTDSDLLAMAKVFRMGRWRTALQIYLPCAFPHALTALTTSLGLAWKSGIAAEVLGTPKFSIGGALRDSKIYLETPDLFAWTLVIILISIVLEKLLNLCVRRWSLRFENREVNGA